MADIIEPTLFLDRGKCVNNIRSFCRKAEGSGISFRPHFKTHQSHEIGRWFRTEGVDRIAVSSVRMAEYFAADGWTDITIAIVFNILEIERVNDLIKKGIRINLTVDSPSVAEYLKKRLVSDTDVFIKIDTGYHRTGILSTDTGSIDRVIGRLIGGRLRFAGFLTHSGHSYRSDSEEDIRGILHDSVNRMSELKRRYEKDFPGIMISYGDTPTVSLADDLSGVDEMRPGNFVFYDLMQLSLGSCSFEQIALILCAPVISMNADRKEVVVNAGAVHFSRELLTGPSGRPVYGEVVRLEDGGWKRREAGSFLVSLSQEHGIISAAEELFDSVSVGDILGIVPVHSCLAADNFGSYLTTDGEVIRKFRI